MKRAIWAVIAIGFLAVSCGGGNIKKVQNGVFSDFDNTITVGKALENNKFLKGGKWKEVEMNGRNYVTYTVKLTGTQVRGFLVETQSALLENKPNFWTAWRFNNNLSGFRSGKTTTMSAEEINQVRAIFKEKFDWNDRNKQNDIEPLLTIDGYELVLSFIMNQDGTFTTNMMEPTTEVTLNCFNNLKVQYSPGNIESAQSILRYIYTDMMPDFLGDL